MEIKQIRADQIKTLEDYATILCLGLVTIRSMELYQAKALECGIMQEVEEEQAKTIIWECRRIEKLIEGQIKNIEVRMDTQMDYMDVINNLAGKRKKKVKCDT